MSKAKHEQTAERTWVPLRDPAPGCADPIYVSFPSPPDDEALAEAEGYLKSLEANGQIARDPKHRAPGTTHELEVDLTGKKKLVRKRYSTR
jgi:hypothetical protein